MKVSTKWLNDYVKVDDLDPLALSEKIERTAVEVDDTYRMQDGLKKIVVGHVLETKDHPDSDHLHICQVDIGEEEPSQIVCGAPNVAAGQKVIVALPNSRIADNVKIKKSKMRGVVSEGMICALQEIGFSETIAPKAFMSCRKMPSLEIRFIRILAWMKTLLTLILRQIAAICSACAALLTKSEQFTTGK